MNNSKGIASDFPFEPHFIDVEGSNLHYVEEGAGDPILFLHGNPTSSYLWRNVIPHLSHKGRCIALDLIGMGKSDKPGIEYRFFDHAKYVEGFIEKMGLKNIILVLHDWGAALGFHYAMRHEDNVKGIAFMEAILLPIPSWKAFPTSFRELFQNFRTPEVGWDLIVKQHFFIEKLLPGGIVRKLDETEMGHYRAPYLEAESRKPLWRWPNELPIAGEPADVVKAVQTYNDALRQSDIPKLLVHAEPGAIFPAPLVAWCRKSLPNLKTVNIGEGLHYVQEDHPHEIGEAVANWVAKKVF